MISGVKNDPVAPMKCWKSSPVAGAASSNRGAVSGGRVGVPADNPQPMMRRAVITDARHVTPHDRFMGLSRDELSPAGADRPAPPYYATRRAAWPRACTA